MMVDGVIPLGGTVAEVQPLIISGLTNIREALLPLS
jgi:hypothetical protein